MHWADETSRTGWLRTGDVSMFTAAVLAEVLRLLHGQSRPDAYIPAALFTASLAEVCGALFLLDAQSNQPERG